MTYLKKKKLEYYKYISRLIERDYIYLSTKQASKLI